MIAQINLKRSLLIVLSVVSLLALDKTLRIADVVDSTGALTLPNGWRITPAGAHINLPGDFPLKMIVSQDGSQLVVNTGGFHDHSLSVIDLRTQRLAAKLNVVKTWAGLAFDPTTETVYLSGGGQVIRRLAPFLKEPDVSPEMRDSIDKPILRARFSDGKLVPQSALSITGLAEKDRYISGIVTGPDHALYVLNFQTDTLYRLSGPDFAQQTSAKTGYRPYSLVFSPEKLSGLAAQKGAGTPVAILSGFDATDRLSLLPPSRDLETHRNNRSRLSHLSLFGLSA
ncbi:MAG TPA: hypothetical protein VK638_23215 [Edaphobacter sp.]|nr:hypothetical protein [Edaphobacter sp.]